MRFSQGRPDSGRFVDRPYRNPPLSGRFVNRLYRAN